MDSIVARSLLTVLVAGCFSVCADAHGGSYTPLGWGIPMPSGPTPAGPTSGTPLGPITGPPNGIGPSTGGDPAGGLVSWRDWWHFNQDAFLDVRRSIQRAAVRTGSDAPASLLRNLLAFRPSPETIRDTLAPALAKLATEERSNELATAALIALARCADPAPADPQLSYVPALRSRLSDASQEVAESAALALGILGDESGLSLLSSLLADDATARTQLGAGRSVSTRTRAFAAYSLGLLADQAHNNRIRQVAARALLAPLETTRDERLDITVATTVALSIDRLDFERGEAQSASWVSRQALVHSLVPVLAETRRRATLRAHVANALALLVLDAPGALRIEVEQALLAELQRGHALENEVAESCVQGLGLLTDADSDPLDAQLRSMLVRQLADNDQPTRFFALIALGEAGGHVGNGTQSEDGRATCRNALINELVRGRSRMRPWAALALGVQEYRVHSQGGEPSSLVREDLRDWLRSQQSPEEVGAGAIALGLCHDEGAVGLLRQKLDASSQTDSQGYVALALGMIGASEATPELRALVLASRYRPWVLEPAAMALALLGDRELQTQLIDALRATQSLSCQSALARAIGQIGDAQALAPLLAIARDTGQPGGTRAFATIALGMLAERHDLPWHVPLARDRNYLAVTPTFLGGDGQGVLEIF